MLRSYRSHAPLGGQTPHHHQQRFHFTHGHAETDTDSGSFSNSGTVTPSGFSIGMRVDPKLDYSMLSILSTLSQYSNLFLFSMSFFPYVYNIASLLREEEMLKQGLRPPGIVFFKHLLCLFELFNPGLKFTLSCCLSYAFAYIRLHCS